MIHHDVTEVDHDKTVSSDYLSHSSNNTFSSLLSIDQVGCIKFTPVFQWNIISTDLLDFHKQYLGSIVMASKPTVMPQHVFLFKNKSIKQR